MVHCSIMWKLPSDVYTISKILTSHGYSVYLVGGAVRNHLGGFGNTDYDLATDAPAKEMLTMFRRVIPTGLEHGTVTVLFGDEHYEITTFRIDGAYSDSRHPDTVTFTSDINQDLSRRDFTINGIAFDIADDKIIDPFNGTADIKRKIIRTIGNAEDRISEDPLRILRGFRFASQLGFTIEKKTREAMVRKAGLLHGISSERIRDELVKLLTGDNAVEILFLLESTGVLQLLLPELCATKGVHQKGFHDFDVFEHSVYAFEWAPKNDIRLMLAALLHDIGKPLTASMKNGDLTFYHHEREGAILAETLLSRLKFSNSIIKSVCHLIGEHMFHYTPEWSDGAVRRFIKRAGKANIDDLFILRRCDEYGFSRRPIDSPALVELGKRIRKVISSHDALGLKDLAVDGNVLHEELGIPKNRFMGTVLNELLETVLDDPSLNTKQSLLVIAQRLYAKISQ